MDLSLQEKHRFEHVQRKATELVKGPEHKSDEEQLKELEETQLGQKEARGEPFCLQHLKGGWSQVLFSQAGSDRVTGIQV